MKLYHKSLTQNIFPLSYSLMKQILDLEYIEADFGDMVDFVPDHHSKANIAIKQAYEFLFPCAYYSFVYSIWKC